MVRPQATGFLYLINVRNKVLRAFKCRNKPFFGIIYFSSFPTEDYQWPNSGSQSGNRKEAALQKQLHMATDM